MTTHRSTATRLIHLVTGLVAAAFIGATAYAQTKWDMPTPYIDTEFHTQNIKMYVEDVKKATNGQLEVVVHSGQSLIKHPDILRAVSSGQVNMAEFILSQFGNEDPMFGADNLPFVATGYDNAFRFYQAQKPYLEKRLASRGLRLLYSVAWPGQGIYTKVPLKSIEDLRGTKFRTYSPLTARFAELLGASPTVLQATDIPQAFATNTVQAMITSSATGVSFKSWEFLKVYYTTSAFHPKNVVVVNERAFQRLPDNQKKALTSLAAQAEKRGWQMSREREKSGNETLAKNGIMLIEPDAAMKATLNKVGEQMLAEWLKTAGADGAALIKAYRGK
ncbi:MAG TPA: TRAP transporter substrate-binding protein [Burkholderiales bacterium]|nr:TRAP transporter substrate-binding protein [Burkholderiales bacterium]